MAVGAVQPPDAGSHLGLQLSKGIVQLPHRHRFDRPLHRPPGHRVEVTSHHLATQAQRFNDRRATAHKGVEHGLVREVVVLVVVLPHRLVRREEGGQDDGAEDRAQPPRPPLVDVGGWAVEVLIMALLLGELVELEQGEGLFDVEGGLMLPHSLPFLLLSEWLPQKRLSNSCYNCY